MSKKAKRAKRLRPIKQLQQRPSVLFHTQARLVDRLQHAEDQVRKGDFAGCITTCESLLDSLPKDSEMRLEILALQGLAHGMLQHFQESYEIFNEAISIDPTRAEFWHNHGLAAYNMGRLVETVRDFERAVEFSKNDASEMARKFAEQLEESRSELQNVMQAHGPDITLEEYAEREERFAQAVRLMKQEKWPEAEEMFRQLTATKARVAPYWGNLGVSLMAQNRYDEADAAFKKALFIDPEYPFARDNLAALPSIRQSQRPIQLKTTNLAQGDDVKQSLALYNKDEEGEITSYSLVERVGHTVKASWRHFGQQSPRYNFFLNPYRDTPFTTCPQCKGKTRSRKFSLVVIVDPKCLTVLDKLCRFCDTCDLLIAHQEQLEEELAIHLEEGKPELIGNDYQVIGTVNPAELDLDPQELSSSAQLIEYIHDFKEVTTFSHSRK